jgi:hypothetical protein
MIAEHLEHAMQFESMAAEATDQQLKKTLLGQAKACRKLARGFSEQCRSGDEQVIADLICDLGHLADDLGFDFLS